MVHKILSALSGRWSLQRKVIGVGVAVGAATFTPKDHCSFLYEETGSLEIAGHQGDFHRSFIYEAANDKIVIRYHDPYRLGDVLHELVFESDGHGHVACHCHVCGQDTYDLQFKISADGIIFMNYQVTGPKKDYKMHTVLTPMVAL